MGIINPTGKGVYKHKGGIPVNEYARVHKWLKYHYGKADCCENENCEHISSVFHYALKKGFPYEKNINNFIKLCVSCHKLYDWKPEYTERLKNRKLSDETKEKLRVANIGKKHTVASKFKMSKRMSGENNPMYGVRISGEQSAWWGKLHSIQSKTKILEANAKVNKEQVAEIKRLFKEKVPQKEIAIKFGISRASVCRIVNNKRYLLWD